jgi:hypothetical protein
MSEEAPDIDAEFALFEQEIESLEPVEDSTAVEESGEPSRSSDVAPPDTQQSDEKSKHQIEKTAGVKRSVQSVYSSAPMAHSGSDDAHAMQVIAECL